MVLEVKISQLGGQIWCDQNGSTSETISQQNLTNMLINEDSFVFLGTFGNHIVQFRQFGNSGGLCEAIEE